ncbi:MAG: nuclear transport factor 2 family protein [Dyadobacter sp.]|uniref:nuclear transport factor 2 family protein n=1 Tax=Dyadobacter sp. TaxID=1914288 RepID=UPI0032650A29
MTTTEIAERLVALSRENKYEQAQKELYSEDAVSIEPEGSPGMTTVKGLDKIVEKGNHFQAMIEEFHGQELSDPVVAGNYFSISLTMDITFKGMGRVPMEEIALYKVADGKIVSEQFFYEVAPAQ